MTTSTLWGDTRLDNIIRRVIQSPSLLFSLKPAFNAGGIKVRKTEVTPYCIRAECSLVHHASAASLQIEIEAKSGEVAVARLLNAHWSLMPVLHHCRLKQKRNQAT
eukprot:3420309-Rhodomonas_salina.2